MVRIQSGANALEVSPPFVGCINELARSPKLLEWYLILTADGGTFLDLSRIWFVFVGLNIFLHNGTTSSIGQVL